MKEHIISGLKIITVQSKVIAKFYIDGIEFILVLFGERDEELPRIYPQDQKLILFLDNEFLEFYRMILIEYYMRLPLPFYNVAFEKFKKNIELAINSISLIEYKKIIKTSYKIFL